MAWFQILPSGWLRGRAATFRAAVSAFVLAGCVAVDPEVHDAEKEILEQDLSLACGEKELANARIKLEMALGLGQGESLPPLVDAFGEPPRSNWSSEEILPFARRTRESWPSEELLEIRRQALDSIAELRRTETDLQIAVWGARAD